jgi:hypothetical protein
MMDDFKIDAACWRFLDDPAEYLKQAAPNLKLEPLARQFKTTREILARLANGRGVLLADDVGLGKTTIGALVAWTLALQGKRVRIYAPNEILRRRWAEELERHLPMLGELGARNSHIKSGKVARLDAGRIQVTTHDTLVKLSKPIKKKPGRQPRKPAKRISIDCDLMIIDEAHRAKGEGSAFNEALGKFSRRAKRKLILTATPFSIELAELEQLLRFVGATRFDGVRGYAKRMKRLYALGDGHDAASERKLLVDAAKLAINEMRSFVIRHGIDDLPEQERKHFGEIALVNWEIPTAAATPEDLALLLRMDRLLQLTPGRKGERRNDPRFHVGWQHVGTELERVCALPLQPSDSVARQHREATSNALGSRRLLAHPKIAAVRDSIRPLLAQGEKVLVFCHHRATAGELLGELENSLSTKRKSQGKSFETLWRRAWESLSGDWPELGLYPDDKEFAAKLEKNKLLLRPMLDWLCSSGLQAQIVGWLGTPAKTSMGLQNQLRTSRPRKAPEGVPSIFDSAKALAGVLLDPQSTSTRALLRSIARGASALGGDASHFPGRLDQGLRVMGAWDHDQRVHRLQTLYQGSPDIVLALFNSPFGPDVLVATDRLSEGVDLHRCCRHLIHYELDPSPVRTIQRNGRIRRVGSWAALTGKPIQYAYPTFAGTRDEQAVAVMRRRIDVFGLLLGGVPPVGDDPGEGDQRFVDEVLRDAGRELSAINRKLCV